MLQHDPHQLLAADVVGQREGLRLVDPHQRRIHHEALLHAEIERDLQRLQRIVAAIGIAGIIRLAHAADEMFDAAPVGDRSGKGEEQQVAPGNESVGQAARGEGDLLVLGERGLAELAEESKDRAGGLRRDAPPMIGKSCFSAARMSARQSSSIAVALAVVETDGLDMRIALERPCEARGGVLSSGEEDQRGVRHRHRQSSGADLTFATLQATH